MSYNTLIGRQPILDPQSNVFAYELLFRDADNKSALDDRHATAQVVTDALLSVGIDKLIGDKTAFINIDRELLLNPAIESIPHDRFVLEILETVTVDEAVISRISELQGQGYIFALDDFEFTDEQMVNFEPIFPFISILKIDVKSCDICKSSEMLRKHFHTFQKNGIELLAEKVETVELFEAYRALGCVYFQGFYFAKPTIIEGKKIDPQRSAIIKIIKLLIANEPTAIIEKALAEAPEISINLLKFLSSASFGVKREITSIKQAITLLGMQPLLKWVTLLLYAFPDSGNPNMKTLMESVLLRAEMMKQLVLASGDRMLAEKAYFTGLISMLDTVLHRPIQEILEDMHFGSSIETAILQYSEILGNALELAKHLESASSKEELCEANKMNLNYELITQAVFAAYSNVIELQKEL